MDLVRDLEGLLGPGGALAEEQAMAPYLIDWRKLYAGHAVAVARPRNTQEVAAVVRLAGAAGLAIVPPSGNTGLVGGSVPLPRGRNPGPSLRRVDPIPAVAAAHY